MSEEKKKKRPLWQKLLIGFAILIVLGGIGKALDKEGGRSTGNTVTANPEQPVAEVTAHQLFEAYKGNEIAADEKYKGKILIVKGTVSDIGKDILDDMYLTLDTGNPILSVQTFFADRFKSRLASMKKGDRVALRCRCDGKFGNVLMKDCAF